MFKPTNQQIACNACIAEGNNLTIQAGAGSGKSSSLRYFAQQNPDKTFLVLCFNKANAVESNQHPDRPANIFYSTVHSIAYRAVVRKEYQDKLAAYLNYRDVPKFSGKYETFLEGAKTKNIAKTWGSNITKCILDIITDYCRSDSKNLYQFALDQLQIWFGNEGRLLDKGGEVYDKMDLPELSSEKLALLAELVRGHWLNLIDIETKYNITHDVYLKLYHLWDNSITSYYDKDTKYEYDIDVLSIDEAQDSNPVTIAIFNNSTIRQKVIIGDSFQQIYAWRGGMNAMGLYSHFTQGQLTESFRFNNEIASLANKVLSTGDSPIRVSGSNKQTMIRTRAHLFRTNSQLLQAIFAYAEAGYTKIFTTADLSDLFSKLYHLQAVSFNTAPKFPNKSLTFVMDSETLASALEINPELQTLLNLSKLVTLKSGTLAKGINRIKTLLVDDEKSAKIALSTVHKAKGLEWDEVTITDKLVEAKKDEDILDKTKDWLSIYENQCLLYVAITRAKVKVNLPEYILDIFGE